MIFVDRAQAGEKLGRELRALSLADPIALAVPRGGMPVAAAVARALDCACDIVPMMKIPIPWFPDASWGAVASDGTLALNEPLVHRMEVSLRELEMSAVAVSQEAKRREQAYRGDRPYPDLGGKTAVIVDDGLGSGYSMLAAIRFARKRAPRGIVVAAPVASESAYALLAEEPGIERLVVLTRDGEQVFSLAAHYKDFPTITDDDVRRFLAEPT